MSIDIISDGSLVDIDEGNRLPIDTVDIGSEKTCGCPPNHLNCMTAKDWIKSQLGVWRFNYEKRDIRDKNLHPATFPISLARRVIELFTHAGELVLDPFVGSGTTLIAAQDSGRNAVGFDLQEAYINLCNKRLAESIFFQPSQHKQLAIQDDALHINRYLKPNTVKLIWTSPPYANLLNRKRKNKSRRGDTRKNEQFGRIEQYSQNKRDLGTMPLEDYTKEIGNIYERLLPILKPGGHCVINVPDMWWENERITILPIPNASEWELKCQRADSSSLITLFHMEPSPRALRFVPKLFLPFYGWTHQEAGKKYGSKELSFRQTISGNRRSDRGFKVIVDRSQEKILISFDANAVDPKHEEWLNTVAKRVELGELNPQPYWGFKDLYSKAGTKLLNCFYVRALVKKESGHEFFCFSDIKILQNFNFDKLLSGIEEGSIFIDIDARTGHNHGTKFRLHQSSFPSLYDKEVSI